MQKRKYGDVTVQQKSSSLLMRVIAFLLKPFVPNFMSGFFTTIGSTIYVPDWVVLDDQFEQKYGKILIHEKTHAADFKKFHILFILTYLLPPALLAYGRFVWERRAYINEFKQYLADGYGHAEIKKMVNEAATVLSSSSYLWCWPKSWIENWFLKELNLVVKINKL